VDAAPQDTSTTGAASELPEPGPVEPLRSCSIITTAANDRMSELHDRMPVILPQSAWDEWLSADEHDTDLLGRLLVPAPSELITFHAVSTEVNNARNRGEHLLDQVDPTTGEPISS
jgi:putative SOS response-associated peptidase YedK